MSPSMTPEMNPSWKRPGRAAAGTRWLLRLVLIAALSLPILGLVGCGGQADKDDVLLATVGEREIKGSYYENRLALLTRDELPRDEQGQVMDMATEAGKQKFLEILINKDVMAVTAVNLGYESDPRIVAARDNLMAIEAAAAMRAEEVTEPANTITEEQLNAFYSRMGSSRHCRYVITNFLDQAIEAREFALSGADWDDVVIQFHDGADAPDGKFEIDVPFGRYKPAYENGVYDCEIGGVTQPLKTTYGYWVLKVESEKPGNPPPLEEAKAQILDVTRSRVMSNLRDDFMASVREHYKFFIDEDALWKCYEGLPRDEKLFYPGTKDAVKREDLLPLDIATVDRELILYGYTDPDGNEQIFSLGDYKTRFDKMSVFQRPKHSQMLGNLREKITADLNGTLVDFASRARGYYDDEIVQLKVNKEVEKMLVNKLFSELVVIDERITPEQLKAFWDEHEADYHLPETRNGNLVVCADRATADKAYAAAVDGMSWSRIIKNFSADKNATGKLDNVRSDAVHPIRDALFNLAVGEISPAFATENGEFGVVKLEQINEPRQLQMADISETLGGRMKQIRQEEVFQTLLAKWKADLEIVTHPENLTGLKSWRELTAAPVPENPVPRNL